MRLRALPERNKMAIWKFRAKKKASGGRMIAGRGKKSREIGRDPLHTKIGKPGKRILKARGGNKFVALVHADTANLSIKGKCELVKIKTVVENPASRHFVRENVMTKGAIINTERGLAKVTSRPTRDGVVNAVLLKK